MANAVSFKVSDALYLVKQAVSTKKGEAKPVEVPTHWTLVIDCSGSMWGNIDKIREQLKKKLPKMIGQKDLITLIWFSGRGQCGVILEAEPVATLVDLAEVNKAIDRWLRALGLTGFKEPLEEAAKVVVKVKKDHPEMAHALVFMSDGCDNQWGRAEVIKTVETVAGGFQSVTLVEYGMYADRNLLSNMAEKAGGSLIFAEDFDRWEPQITAVLGKKVSGAPRIDVKIPGDPIKGFAFTVSDGDLVTYAIEGGVAKVPEDTTALFFLNPSAIGLVEAEITELAKQNSPSPVIAATYAAVSLFAVRMQPNTVFALLKSLGDVQYILQFGSCFGKQKYSDFMEVAKAAAFDQALRFLQGYDPNKVPRDDSFTVLELLQILASDDDNRILMDHPKFRYSRIGRGRLDANSVLTKDELAERDRLMKEMSGTRDLKKQDELMKKIAAIGANKPAPLKFEEDPVSGGYPVDALVLNEESPNISLRVKKFGKVDISSRLTAEVSGVPATVPTFIYRNYAIVKHGLVNVEILPVNVSTDTLMKLDKVISEGLAPKELLTADSDGTLIINVKCLPVINRQMVQTASAKTLFTLEWELIKARAAQKVYKEALERLVGKKEAIGLKTKFGETNAKWLGELGFTDNGFSPRSLQADASDFYMGKELAVKIKSFSSLPKVSEVREKMAKKAKLTPSAAIMAPYVTEVENFLGSDAYTKAADPKKALTTWIEKKTKESILSTRKLISDKAKLLFSIIVGQVWFSEFASLEENTLTLQLDGQDLSCTVEMNEVEVKI